jgi:hypothetical protein
MCSLADLDTMGIGERGCSAEGALFGRLRWETPWVLSIHTGVLRWISADWPMLVRRTQ